MQEPLARSDDQGLWDELNYHESREFHQYQAQQAARRGWFGTTTDTSIGELIGRTTDIVNAALGVPNGRYEAANPLDHWNSMGVEFAGNPSHHSGSAVGQQSYPSHHTGSRQQSYGFYTSLMEPNGTSPQNADQSQSTFVFLDSFRWLAPGDGWSAVANLDVFFTTLYNYYYHRGLLTIFMNGVVELATLFFTLWLSIFLFAYVDWRALTSCTDEQSCLPEFKDYLIKKPFSTLSLWNFLLVLYCLLFFAYSVFAIWSFLHSLRDAWEAKLLFEEKLGISERKLQGGAVDWDRDVINKLLELQTSGQYRVAIHGQELDALVVAQRIMRKENFMVAFFNRDMLNLSVPCFPGKIYSKTIEWSLYFCILNFMFNHKYQIRPAFCLDPASLKQRFKLCGIFQAIFMPFLLLFMTLHFSLQNAYAWKSTKQYLGPRDWSLSAKWTFREFNELPHFFERRMGPSYDAAEGYLKLFSQSEMVTALGRILVFIGGALGAVLFVFAAINDAILLHVKIADWNLLWYAGLLAGLFSAGKSMMPSEAAQPGISRNLFSEMDAALANVATHTHHFPDTWRGRGWNQTTNSAFSSMFKYKAQLFLMEVMSVILAPYVLCISLPQCAEDICNFVLAVKAEVAGAGEVCGYSTFNFDMYTDEQWEGRTMGYAHDSHLSLQHNGDSQTRASAFNKAPGFGKPQARQGKMEKSFFNFKAAHPNWKCSESGQQQLVDMMEQFQREESAALSRERELHIEAAVRQLETLKALEKRRQQSQYGNASIALDEGYIARAAAAVKPNMNMSQVPTGSALKVDSNNNLTPAVPPLFQDHEGTANEEEYPPFAAPPSPTLADGKDQTQTDPMDASRLGPPPPMGLSASTSTEMKSSLRAAGALSQDLESSFQGLYDFVGSGVAGGSISSLAGSGIQRPSERNLVAEQYMWLERYHSQKGSKVINKEEP